MFEVDVSAGCLGSPKTTASVLSDLARACGGDVGFSGAVTDVSRDALVTFVPDGCSADLGSAANPEGVRSAGCLGTGEAAAPVLSRSVRAVGGDEGFSRSASGA